MNSEWQKVQLKDVLEINPKESIKKGKLSKKIAMDKLKPFCRDIIDYELTAFNGGAKFRNGDTIMASITPCLENGKVAKVNILDDDEVGFGSTEYIIFRAIKNITDSDFVYYLICSDIVREPAIKSMVGSSGRQRVQKDVVANLEINIPPYNEQVKISSILKSLDDKIELNNQINKNLEQQAQAIFKSWFNSTKNGYLSDLCQYAKEKISISKLTLNNYYSTENILPNKAGVNVATNLPKIIKTTKCNIGDILVSNIRPYFKKIAYCHNEGGCSNDVLCFTPYKREMSPYIFNILYEDNFFDFMMTGSKGTKMPRRDKQQIMTYSIYIPDSIEVKNFNNIAEPILEQIKINTSENIKLSLIRDLLLPKLMNGEIDVSVVEI